MSSGYGMGDIAVEAGATDKVRVQAHVDFVAWATFNRETLARFDLIATRHTARLVRI